MPRRRTHPGSSVAPEVGGEWVRTAEPDGNRFISADDFDATGILAGVDTCAASYWWVPELQASPELPPMAASGSGVTGHAAPGTAPRHQAARRSTSRSSTAAA